MFTELNLTNFKGFQGTHNLRLAPLTLIFGPNSSGKSAIIKSLLMLSQSLEPHGKQSITSSASPIQFTGDLVNLANFQTSIFRGETQREMSIGFATQTRPQKSDKSYDEHSRLSLDFKVVLDGGSLKLKEVNIESSGNKLRFAPKRIKSSTQTLTLGHSVNDASIHALLAESDEKPSSVNLERFVKYIKSYEVQRAGFMPHFSPEQLFQDFFAEDKIKEVWRRQFPGSRLSQNDSLAIQTLSLHWLSHLSHDLRRLRGQLQSLTHIGPLRSISDRIQNASPDVYITVGPRGERTADLLARRNESRKSINLQVEVNQWLSKMKIGYHVEVETVSSNELPHIGNNQTLVFTDSNTQVKLGALDVGVGISQVLPIVVQCLAYERRTLLIEEPELHLHPRLQSSLAELFVDSAITTRRNQIVVETHSEHLILRLLKLIRDGQVSTKDVSVIYVESGEDGSFIKHLEIDSDGIFVDTWPDGFFADPLYSE